MHNTPILARIASAGLLLLTMAGFATADALLIAQNPLPSTQGLPGQTSTSSSSNAGIIGKQQGVNIQQVSQAIGIELVTGDVQSFLTQVITQEPVQQNVLLYANDRIGTISWVESPQVKLYYTALKEALHQNFSPLVTDLQDRTETTEQGVTYNYLTFLDTGISEERITFLRIRDQLYELRTTIGSEQIADQLQQALKQ